MRNDRLFMQCFAAIAIGSTLMCIWKEDAFSAVVLMLIAISMIFIARNIGHLIRCYSYQQRMFRILRELTCLMRENNCCNTGVFHDLSDIIDSLDRIEEEINLQTKFD